MAVYVSDLLTVTPAPVDATPTSTRTLQWLRGSTAISGATSSTYTAVADDIGSTISARQSETNFLGTATATSAPTEVIQAFDPIRLFSASEPGVWYDPNDITTLFKGTSNFSPVTTPGDAVSLMLDKSRGGEQSLPTTGWTVNSGDGVVTIVDNVITITGATTTTRVDINSPGWAVGDYAKITVNSSIGSAVGPGVFVGGAGFYSISAGVGTYSSVLAASTLLRLQVTSGSATFTVTARSRTPGNHATQSTTASQPIYGIVPAGGRRNQITFSEQIDNAVWTKQNGSITSTSELDPLGGTTADKFTPSATASLDHRIIFASTPPTTGGYTLSMWVKPSGYSKFGFRNGAVGTYATFDLSGAGSVIQVSGLTASIAPAANGFYRVEIKDTSSSVRVDVYAFDNSYTTGSPSTYSYTGDGISGILIWGVQLELGSTATPYQRVTTQYDVTEAGVASLGYLQFNGVSNAMFMATSTITPGTNKVQVFAGVRKLNDTIAVVAEFSPDLNTSSGGFLFLCGSNNVTGFELTSKGTISGIGTTGRYAIAAPVTVAFTGIADISAPLAQVRVNGVVGIDGTSTQGTGNYLSYPLYIGARSGGSLPLNGQLFPLIVRFGPNLTTARIQSTELWVGERTPGIDLEKVFSPIIYARDNTAILDRANSTIERRAV